MQRFLPLGTLVCLLPAAVMAGTFNAAETTNQVGLDVFRVLRADRNGANLVVSPYSIESALALAYAGADGSTRAEMARTLHLPDDDSSVRAGFAAVRASLNRMVKVSQRDSEAQRRFGGGHDPIQWRVANRLFGQEGYAFRESFLALMRNGYQAPFQPLDFRRGVERARSTINHWVADQTADKIRDLVPPGGVTVDTRLVLVNTLYLKAPWLWPFSERATEPHAFHFADGTSHDVPTMRHMANYGYAKENQATIVTLPYVGTDLQFVIVLPDAGVGVETIAQALSVDAFERWAVLGESSGKVDLSLPKLRVDSGTLELAKALEKLGIHHAFDDPPHSANFDRIAPRKPDDYLALSDVFHRTFVAVDEKGTEATAATAVSMVAATAFHPETPIEVRVDRPFLFAIQHRPTGVCLFLGQITDPR